MIRYKTGIPEYNEWASLIIKDYIDGLSLPDMAKKYKRCERTIHHILKLFKIPTNRRPSQDKKERFYQNVQVSDDCWIWKGYKNKKGYGTISIGNKDILAHRLSYEIHNGPIPDGMNCLHFCDRPECVSPHHLWLGTLNDNNQDMINKGRNAKGSMYPHAKLNESKVAKILVSNKSTNELKDEYKVSYRLIEKVKAKEIWKHVEIGVENGKN